MNALENTVVLLTDMFCVLEAVSLFNFPIPNTGILQLILELLFMKNHIRGTDRTEQQLGAKQYHD